MRHKSKVDRFDSLDEAHDARAALLSPGLQRTIIVNPADPADA
jgi:hypothetical protein